MFFILLRLLGASHGAKCHIACQTSIEHLAEVQQLMHGLSHMLRDTEFSSQMTHVEEYVRDALADIERICTK